MVSFLQYVLEWGPSLPVLKYEYNLRPIQHFLLISSTRNLGYCYWSTHSRTDRALSVLLCVKIYCYQSHITDTRNPSIWNFKKFQIDHPRSGTSDCSTDSIFLCVYAICVPVEMWRAIFLLTDNRSVHFFKMWRAISHQ